MARGPAPDIEDIVWRAVAARAGISPTLPNREVLEAYVYKVTVQPGAVEMALKPAQKAGNQPSSASPEIVSLPWARKPLVAAKGVAWASLGGPALTDSRTREAVLAAIGKARHWVDELTEGIPLAQIARGEGRGERQIRALMPLAFLSPAVVKGLVDGSIRAPTVTELARRVPLIWKITNFPTGP